MFDVVVHKQYKMSINIGGYQVTVRERIFLRPSERVEGQDTGDHQIKNSNHPLKNQIEIESVCSSGIWFWFVVMSLGLRCYCLCLCSRQGDDCSQQYEAVATKALVKVFPVRCLFGFYSVSIANKVLLLQLRPPKWAFDVTRLSESESWLKALVFIADLLLVVFKSGSRQPVSIPCKGQSGATVLFVNGSRTLILKQSSQNLLGGPNFLLVCGRCPYLLLLVEEKWTASDPLDHVPPVSRRTPLSAVGTGMVEHKNGGWQDWEETSRVDWDTLKRDGCAPIREGWRPAPPM